MKPRQLDLSDNPIHATHEALGLPPVEIGVARDVAHPALRIASGSALLLMAGNLAYLASRLLQRPDAAALVVAVLHSEAFWWAVGVGLIAQAVGGALGMAYGVTSTSDLMATGASPAAASAAVHIAEVFTTGVSGIAHSRLGHVDRSLILRLLVPGIAGATLGAWLVSSVDAQVIKPFASAYLLVMGVHVLSKAFRTPRRTVKVPRHVAKLGLTGGFVDAAGGDGWGPVVTTTLVGSGCDPRRTIGSVNLAESFLTFLTAGVFTMLVDETPWPLAAGVVVGGLSAAPLAALMTRRVHARVLLILVGTVIAGVSSLNLWRAVA